MLSDCIKCWDTPCSCGWEYKNITHEYMVKFIKGVVSYHRDKIEILKDVISEIEKEKN